MVANAGKLRGRWPALKGQARQRGRKWKFKWLHDCHTQDTGGAAPNKS